MFMLLVLKFICHYIQHGLNYLESSKFNISFINIDAWITNYKSVFVTAYNDTNII